MELIHLPEVDSTNNYLRKLLEELPELPQYTMVDAYAQTAGRGQRGNHWESAPGQNISCTLLLRPQLPEGATTFDLNVLVSLALYDTLSRYIDPESIFIKWPNDIIICQDRKIAGILIENEWLGSSLEYSIIGIGLNVQQTTFGDYYPVATSLAIEGSQLPEEYHEWHYPLLEQIANRIKRREEHLRQDLQGLRQEYHHHLLGLGEERPYALPDGTQLTGTIQRVEPNGLLAVSTSHGIRLFPFKQIRFLPLN